MRDHMCFFLNIAVFIPYLRMCRPDEILCSCQFYIIYRVVKHPTEKNEVLILGYFEDFLVA